MNSEKKKLLIVYCAKFGFHVVSYYLAKYSREEFDVTYLGLVLDDTGCSLSLDGLVIKEVQCTPGLRFRLSLINHLRKELDSGNYDLIFCQYFMGISLLKPFIDNSKFIVDVRSGFLFKNRIKRIIYNSVLKHECNILTNNITINSLNLGEFIGFDKSNLTQLPLGAECNKIASKKQNKINFIYVGTLDKREIHKVVLAFARLCSSSIVNVGDLNIVGSGVDEEIDKINNIVKEYDLSERVHMHGYVTRDRVINIIDNCHIGISFVPKTDFYNLQPVTKTIEYILSGLPVLATDVFYNRKIINDSNGFLTGDNVEELLISMTEIVRIYDEFDPEIIQKNGLVYSWSKVIHDQYIPYFKSII
ncbi:glycosyltransferase family 4 protein [Vibrio sp. Evd11]|uniref:glycosyltransferase family 4 protein n=1 Tax=Vibrio sp. Evd11 TaxID=1207404 RepID=UPI000EFBCE7F|nr:glycosyltransferase family 4 protein [Vibrio sp. Evd11]